MVASEASDMQIVCREHRLLVEPVSHSPEEEVVVNIKEIIQHPSYRYLVYLLQAIRCTLILQTQPGRRTRSRSEGPLRRV